MNVCVLSHIVSNIEAPQTEKNKTQGVILKSSSLSDPKTIMSSHYKIFSLMICLLLLTTMFPVVQSRRSGGFGRGGGGTWGGESAGRVGWGAGGSHPHHAPPAHTTGSSGHNTGRVGWGAGGGHLHHAPPTHTGGSSGHSTGKVVGAAAAGALGGMLIGHGLSSMAQPGHGYGHGYGHGHGHGYGGHGHGHGHPRHGAHGGEHLEDHANFHNETDMDYYVGAASAGPIYSCVMVFGAVMSLLLGHFLS